MPLQYCVTLPNGGSGADPRTLAEFAAIAEDAGWDAVFLEDYLVYQGKPEVPTSDPWLALAAMALRTTRLRLGTMVTPSPAAAPGSWPARRSRWTNCRAVDSSWASASVMRPP